VGHPRLLQEARAAPRLRAVRARHPGRLLSRGGPRAHGRCGACSAALRPVVQELRRGRGPGRGAPSASGCARPGA
jgi:hypothetical protein